LFPGAFRPYSPLYGLPAFCSAGLHQARAASNCQRASAFNREIRKSFRNSRWRRRRPDVPGRNRPVRNAASRTPI